MKVCFWCFFADARLPHDHYAA